MAPEPPSAESSPTYLRSKFARGRIPLPRPRPPIPEEWRVKTERDVGEQYLAEPAKADSSVVRNDAENPYLTPVSTFETGDKQVHGKNESEYGSRVVSEPAGLTAVNEPVYEELQFQDLQEPNERSQQSDYHHRERPPALPPRPISSTISTSPIAYKRVSPVLAGEEKISLPSSKKKKSTKLVLKQRIKKSHDSLLLRKLHKNEKYNLNLRKKIASHDWVNSHKVLKLAKKLHSSNIRIAELREKAYGSGSNDRAPMIRRGADELALNEKCARKIEDALMFGYDKQPINVKTEQSITDKNSVRSHLSAHRDVLAPEKLITPEQLPISKISDTRMYCSDLKPESWAKRISAAIKTSAHKDSRSP